MASPDDGVQAQIRNIEERYGRPIGDWIELIRATRIDVGLILCSETETTERLEPAAGFNALFTHRVRVQSAADVDAQLQHWLDDAYQAGLAIHCPSQSASSLAEREWQQARASNPDDLDIRHGVVVGILRNDGNAMGYGGGSDPTVVDRRLPSRRTELGDQQRPGFRDGFVRCERLEPLSDLIRRQSSRGGLWISGLQHAKPQFT
jgi:hypothetical protein